MLNGAVESELKCGCVKASSFTSFLENVTALTELELFQLYSDETVIYHYPADKSVHFPMQGDEGKSSNQHYYYVWKSVHWPNIKGLKVPAQGKQRILLALPMAQCRKSHEIAADKFWTTIVIGLISVLIFWLSYYYTIKNLYLKKRVDLLQQHKSQLTELNLAATGLAHETKNPLGIIRGLAQRISKSAGNSEDVSQMSQEIVEQADVTADRLGDFMNYAKCYDVTMAETNIKEALAAELTVIQQDCEQLGVEFSEEIGDINVLADKKMLSQIVTNLLFNSLRAVSGGQTICVYTRAEGKKISLIVEDTGKGMTEEFCKEIFKPYVTGSNGGHGIGLSVVKRCVTALDWEISVESEAGRGTTIALSNIEPA